MKTFRPPVLKKDNGIARCMVDGNVWIRGLDVAVARLTKKPNYASAATCLFANQLPGYDARVIRSLKDTGWYFDEKHLPDFVAFLSDDEKVAEAVKITHAGIAKSKAKKAA